MIAINGKNRFVPEENNFTNTYHIDELNSFVTYKKTSFFLWEPLPQSQETFIIIYLFFWLGNMQLFYYFIISCNISEKSDLFSS